LSKFVQESPTS